MINPILFVPLAVAILSPFAWLIKRRIDNGTVQVKTNLGVQLGFMASREPQLFITSIKKGSRPVTITASGFRLDIPNEPNIVTIIDRDLPRELSDGQSHTSYIDMAKVPFTKILYAWARDATGREYRSKRKPFK
jgi:hypothetical protein